MSKSFLAGIALAALALAPISPAAAQVNLNLNSPAQIGIGALTPVPTGSTNGTPISCPAGSSGIRFYLGAADSVTLAFATAQPTSPPLTFKISGASGGTGPNWDENLAGGVLPYVVATTGAPLDRCY